MGNKNSKYYFVLESCHINNYFVIMTKYTSSYIKITISVPAEVVKELDRIAKLESRTRSGQATFFMNQGISHNGVQSHSVVD